MLDIRLENTEGPMQLALRKMTFRLPSPHELFLVKAHCQVFLPTVGKLELKLKALFQMCRDTLVDKQ